MPSNIVDEAFDVNLGHLAPSKKRERPKMLISISAV